MSSMSLPLSRKRDDDIGYCARLFADIDRRVDAIVLAERLIARKDVYSDSVSILRQVGLL